MAGALRRGGTTAESGRRANQGGILGRWIGSDAFAAQAVATTVNGLIDRQLRGYLPNPEGMTAEHADAGRRRSELDDQVLDLGLRRSHLHQVPAVPTEAAVEAEDLAPPR